MGAKQNKAKRSKGSSSQSQNNGNRTPMILVIVAVIYTVVLTVIFATCCVLLLFSHSSPSAQLSPAEVPVQPENILMEEMPQKMKVKREDESGTVFEVVDYDPSFAGYTRVILNYGHYKDMFYFQCKAPVDMEAPLLLGGTDLVILDGGSFFSAEHFSINETTLPPNRKYSEETFMELCQQGFSMGLKTITGLDIDEVIEPSQFSEMLLAFREKGKITSLPLAALVTPSKSAASVADWISYGDIHSLRHDFARHWITVSSRFDEVDDLRNMGDWPVLALFGADDPLGKETAHKMATRMEAQTKVIPGDQDCYKNHHQEFATAIKEYLYERLF